MLSRMHPVYNRGEIWLANLNPGKGTEPGKIRPVLIIQCQDLLDVCHPSTLIIPLTTNLIVMAEPLRVRIPAQARLVKDSDILVDQLRAIDNKRLVDGPLMLCPPPLMTKINQCLMEVLGI